MEPFVGAPDHDRTRCGFSLEPDAPRCADAPTRHLLVRSDAWGLVALSSCEEHAPVANAAGELRGEHPYTIACAHPAARWHGDVCVVVVSEAVA